ncbi:hypothetical protein LECLMA074M_09765 [Leclercia sp. M-A074-M]
MKMSGMTPLWRLRDHRCVIKMNHLVKSAGMINLLNCLVQLLMNDFALFE